MTHEFSICNELRTLGITANYKGYKQAAWAIHLALDDERRLDDISSANGFSPCLDPAAGTFSGNRRVRTARTTNRFRLSSHSGEPSPHECPSNGIH